MLQKTSSLILVKFLKMIEFYDADLRELEKDEILYECNKDNLCFPVLFGDIKHLER